MSGRGNLLVAPDLLEPLADLFYHLSDPHRLQLLLAMSSREYSVGELALHVKVTVSAVSHQLQILKRARLVSCRRDGKTIYYQLADDHVRQLVHIGCEHVQE
jgi:ArsR family transcriptional regulator